MYIGAILKTHIIFQVISQRTKYIFHFNMLTFFVFFFKHFNFFYLIFESYRHLYYSIFPYLFLHMKFIALQNIFSYTTQPPISKSIAKGCSFPKIFEFRIFCECSLSRRNPYSRCSVQSGTTVEGGGQLPLEKSSAMDKEGTESGTREQLPFEQRICNGILRWEVQQGYISYIMFSRSSF